MARFQAWWIRRVLKRPVLWTDRYGLRFRLQPEDDLAMYFVHRGWFERSEQEFCRRYVRDGMIVFDVGAYIGMFTCLLGRLVGRHGAVHAFEPAPQSYDRLAEHVALNRLDNVHLNREAVAGQRGNRTLFLYPPPLESLSSLVREHVPRAGGLCRALGHVTVGTRSLDDYCAQHGIEVIDLLKIDAEGAEWEILAGAGSLLKRTGIRAILFEVGPQAETAVHHLQEAGFDMEVLDDEGTARPATLTDILSSRNAVARHRAWHQSGTG